MIRRALSACVLAAAIGGCGHHTQTFESRVKIVRFDVIRRGPDGRPRTADVEIEWLECPGEQREVQRVDAKFLQCFSSHHVDETLPVTVQWTDEGVQLDWDVTHIGECERTTEVDDDVSFDMVHECSETVEQGEKVGFHCDRAPSGALLAKCPWFRRH